ncbi:MAG TPA: hypothetical protein V6D07_09920 [Trichocoleus sp.]
MSVQLQSKPSRRFVDPWPIVTGGIALAMLLALLSSAFMGKLVASTTLNIDPEDTEELPPVQVKQTAIGALRIEAEARIPQNRWVTFEIQVLDSQDNVLASAIKQAWSESGTWSEEGETGTWEESDLNSGFDIRPQQAEPLTLAIHVLEYTDPTGQEIDEPVPIRVMVRNGVVDGRYLWAGLIGTSLLALFSRVAVSSTGTKIIDKTIPDSDIGDRIVMGGSDRLLRVMLEIEADETSPKTLQAHVYVKDSQGEQIYAHSHPVSVNYKRDEGKIEGATGNLTLFFVLEPRRSYGFYIEVSPDGPVDKTQLVVLEGAKTFGSIDVIHIKTN